MKKNSGFTLLELLIVLAIIAVLASLAIPSYQSYILRGYRTEARNTLEAAALKMQQNYSITRKWNKDGSDQDIDNSKLESWGLHKAPAGAIGGKLRYRISFKEITENGFKLVAAAEGNQKGDKLCQFFYIDNRGIRGASPTDNPSVGSRDPNSQECWKR